MVKAATYEAPTWSQIHSMLQRQAKKICARGLLPDIIIGVCRGGWIPARILSDLLGHSNLVSVKVECYKGIGKATEEPELTQRVSTDPRGKSVLVVDEVTDTGRTLRLVVNHLNELGAEKVWTATLYYKSRSMLKPDFFEKQTASWVIFPWDVKEALRSVYETYKASPSEITTEFTKLADAGVPKLLITRFWKEFQEANRC